MIYVCEQKESEYSSFHKEIKKDKNGIELLDSIIAAEGDLTDFIQYLNLDERYHYFLKEYIKNKSSFDSFTEEDFCDFLKTNKDKKFKYTKNNSNTTSNQKKSKEETQISEYF